MKVLKSLSTLRALVVAGVIGATLHASAVVVMPLTRGGERLVVFAATATSIAVSSAVATTNMDKTAIVVPNMLIIVAMLVVMDDRTSMPQLKVVTDGTASSAGLSPVEQQSVNANLVVINAVLSASLQDSEAKGFDQKSSVLALNSAFEENLDATTLSGLNKIRTTIAEQPL